MCLHTPQNYEHTVPLRSTPLYGSLWGRILSLRRRGKGLCHSTRSCGLGNTLQLNKGSGNMSGKNIRRCQRRKRYKQNERMKTKIK